MPKKRPESESSTRNRISKFEKLAQRPVSTNMLNESATLATDSLTALFDHPSLALNICEGLSSTIEKAINQIFVHNNTGNSALFTAAHEAVMQLQKIQFLAHCMHTKGYDEAYRLFQNGPDAGPQAKSR